MPDPETLFALFLREKQYLAGLSPRTIRSYKQAFQAFKRHKCALTASGLKEWIISLQEEGLKPGAINVYVRSMNSFLGWLVAEKHIEESLKVKQLKAPKPEIEIFRDEDVKKILRYKAKGFYDWRLYVSVCLMLDTGMRISEVLDLRVEDVNLDQCLLLVRDGKGGKARWVPFSLELRRLLWRYLKMRPQVGPYLFATRSGLGVQERNYRRDLKEWLKMLGFKSGRLSPHTFRHYFAVTYLSGGGDLYTLSKILGHSSLQVTEVYLRSMGIERIAAKHQGLSPLARRYD